ncbi:MAG: sucrase ferredoxin [Actinomycetota bacterium]
MTTSLDRLLPGPDAALRCADHARGIRIDPGGTAIRADRVICVDTPAPWPKPALAHELLSPLAAVLADDPVPTRLLAATGPGFGATASPGDGVAVVLYRRFPDGAGEQRFRVADAEDLAAWGTALGTVEGADDPSPLAPWAEGPATAATPAVLICTQGSHDVCCGSDGVRFAAEAEAATGDFDVYRVSHTGGHRFAPTAMTLPDGRMWADLDLDTLRAVAAEAGAVGDVVDRCRGWWGADTGPAQVAERAVLAEVGWEFNHRLRTVTVETSPVESPAPDRPEGAVAALVTADDDTWRVTVAPGRRVPTIACRQPGGLPVKEAREYDVLSIVALGA